MWQFLTTESEVLVQAGFLYAPLLLDPEIAAETAAKEDDGQEDRAGVLVRTKQGDFIKSLSLASLVTNYAMVFPEEYAAARLSLRRSLFPEALAYQPPLDARLKTIIFEILPHFLGLRKARQRPQRQDLPVLAHLAGKIPVPAEAGIHLERLREQEAVLLRLLRRLEQAQIEPAPPPEGVRPGGDLVPWFQAALRATVISQEIALWRQELTRIREFLELPGPELAILLGITAQGAVEVDGVGFCPDDRWPGEFLIYKRTGEFVLKDFFNRLYLFPDCRVGVSTAGPFHPVVLDHYKHPLLRRWASRQKICLTEFQPAPVFSAAGVIAALEEGLNALYYGYNSRKRNGYNSLDRFGRDLSVVDFEDWRIPGTDPRLAAGSLEVTNRTW